MIQRWKRAWSANDIPTEASRRNRGRPDVMSCASLTSPLPALASRNETREDGLSSCTDCSYSPDAGGYIVATDGRTRSRGGYLWIYACWTASLSTSTFKLNLEERCQYERHNVSNACPPAFLKRRVDSAATAAAVFAPYGMWFASVIDAYPRRRSRIIQHLPSFGKAPCWCQCLLAFLSLASLYRASRLPSWGSENFRRVSVNRAAAAM